MIWASVDLLQHDTKQIREEQVHKYLSNWLWHRMTQQIIKRMISQARNNSRIIRFVLSREKRRRRTNESSDHKHDEMHHYRQRAFRSFLSRDCVNHMLNLANNLLCHLRCQLLWEDKKLSTSHVKFTKSKIDDWFATEEI